MVTEIVTQDWKSKLLDWYEDARARVPYNPCLEINSARTTLEQIVNEKFGGNRPDLSSGAPFCGIPWVVNSLVPENEIWCIHYVQVTPGIRETRIFKVVNVGRSGDGTADDGL